MTAGVGPLKIICKDEFRGAGAVRETCPSDGRGADLPRGSIRSSALPGQGTHFEPSLTFSWQARHFREIGWKNRKLHWHGVSSTCNFDPRRKSHRIASLWMFQNEKLRKSRQL
jgi:hypothetical protein